MSKYGGSLSGKSFCLTGTLTTMTREQAASTIKSRGGRFDTSPTYMTTYLVVGEKAGATKLKAGKAKGCIQLTETQFLQMLNDKITIYSLPETKKEEPKPVEPPKPQIPLGLQVRDW